MKLWSKNEPLGSEGRLWLKLYRKPQNPLNRTFKFYMFDFTQARFGQFIYFWRVLFNFGIRARRILIILLESQISFRKEQIRSEHLFINLHQNKDSEPVPTGFLLWSHWTRVRSSLETMPCMLSVPDSGGMAWTWESSEGQSKSTPCLEGHPGGLRWRRLRTLELSADGVRSWKVTACLNKSLTGLLRWQTIFVNVRFSTVGLYKTNLHTFAFKLGLNKIWEEAERGGQKVHTKKMTERKSQGPFLFH